MTDEQRHDDRLTASETREVLDEFNDLIATLEPVYYFRSRDAALDHVNRWGGHMYVARDRWAVDAADTEPPMDSTIP